MARGARFFLMALAGIVAMHAARAQMDEEEDEGTVVFEEDEAAQDEAAASVFIAANKVSSPPSGPFERGVPVAAPRPHGEARGPASLPPQARLCAPTCGAIEGLCCALSWPARELLLLPRLACQCFGLRVAWSASAAGVCCLACARGRADSPMPNDLSLRFKCASAGH